MKNNNPDSQTKQQMEKPMQNEITVPETDLSETDLSETDEPTMPENTRRRGVGDRGEGVISAAIAVLIMAFLGAAMWVGFQQMWKTTESTTNEKIMQIGSR
ncbi:hypothetical protein MCETE7_00736 [Acidimicrobiia bacterium]